MSDDLLRTPTEGQDLAESLFPGSTVKGSPSPRLSFKGWSFTTWAAKNAKFVKDTVALASAATYGMAIVDLASLKTFALIWGLAAAAIGTRAFVDAVHYFISEQPPAPGAGA